MPARMHKAALQIVIALGALVPILAGLSGLVMGPAMVPGMAPTPISFDSHFHYLSGLLLGIGLGFWSCIPHIELRAERFRVLTGIVVVGGLGRAVAICVSGWPDHAMQFGLAMELLVTPLLAVWQGKVAQRFVSRPM